MLTDGYLLVDRVVICLLADNIVGRQRLVGEMTSWFWAGWFYHLARWMVFWLLAGHVSLWLPGWFFGCKRKRRQLKLLLVFSGRKDQEVAPPPSPSPAPPHEASLGKAIQWRLRQNSMSGSVQLASAHQTGHYGEFAFLYAPIIVYKFLHY